MTFAKRLTQRSFNCRPGGALLIAPIAFPKQFNPAPKPADMMDRKEVCVTWNDVGARLRPITPMPWTMRSSCEIPPVRVEHDRHVEELFKRAEWLAFLQDAGFVHSDVDYPWISLWA